MKGIEELKKSERGRRDTLLHICAGGIEAMKKRPRHTKISKCVPDCILYKNSRSAKER